MQEYIHSGYYHIYRPPYSLTEGWHKSSIYVLTDRFNTTMVLVPLVPSFYKDVVDIVKASPARKIYLIASDIGLPFVSDYYLSWDTITKTLKRECKIFSKYMVENFSYGPFKRDIIRTENDNLSIEVPRSNMDVGTIDISFTKKNVSSAAPFSCDVVINDTYRRRIFIGEMNDHKAEFLNKNRDLYDEIHMAYITSNYDGWTYQELIKEYPALVTKVYCNQFASHDEYLYAKNHSIRVGEAFNNDFI